ncbi:MAG: signal peptidase I [Lachnospiraceae bacterium]|nr:signal peptidase I [Lachnospiraceae bacterium]
MEDLNYRSTDVTAEAKEEPAAADKGKKKEKWTRKKIIREVLSYVFYIALAVCIALLWRTFVLMKVEVVSGSMQNTLKINDRLMVSKLPFIFGKIERGDIVVFHFPDDESQIFVKRVIGLPGETVDIVGGRIFIDGTPLAESYVSTIDTADYGPYLVPSGCYFVLGDNRANSWDARKWTNTYVMDSQIIGKALFRYKPKLEKIYNND